MASVPTSDLIETQVYQLTYINGASNSTNGPIQDININVPFKVRKLVFKPMMLYVAAGGGNVEAGPDGNGPLGAGAYVNDVPNLIFCNLYDVNKAIGYLGFYTVVPGVVPDPPPEPPNPATAVEAYTGYYSQQMHDVTFSVRNLMNINGSYKFYLYNSASKCYYDTSPFSGIVTITVEYHGQ